ncbi:unnamed protein product [marine sediment metagenome]|uniref:Uncharacterized protein n=1 Tax=marine sediment metagenome TaxID=412755 RepID=X1UQK7_9ZZZZ
MAIMVYQDLEQVAHFGADRHPEPLAPFSPDPNGVGADIIDTQTSKFACPHPRVES